MAKPKESDFKVEDVTPSIAMQLLDGLIETATFGATKAGQEVIVTNTKTGESHRGWGEDRHSAKGNAHSKFGK